MAKGECGASEPHHPSQIWRRKEDWRRRRREPWPDAVKWAAEAKWIFGEGGTGRAIQLVGSQKVKHPV